MASSRHPEYSLWSGMNRRCSNESDPSYPRYGGSGIRVFEEWSGPGGFKAFIEYMGPRPSPKHQIDRINNALGYSPGNVRWATTMEQARNRTNNLYLEFNGERLIAADWANRLGISPQSMQKRLREWPLHRALTQKAARRRVMALPACKGRLTPAMECMLSYAKCREYFSGLEYATRDGQSYAEVGRGPLGSVRNLAGRLCKAGFLEEVSADLFKLTTKGRAALSELEERQT